MPQKNYTLTYMLDCSRNAVINLTALRRLVGVLQKCGYTGLSLYCENTYEVQNEPYFGYMRGRYSEAELRDIDALCRSAGLEFTLSVQTLAHMRGIYRFYYDTVMDCNDVLLADDDRTYTLIDNMFASLARSLWSKKVNIGMDESFMLGRGKHLDRHGWQPPQDIFRRHLQRVLALADKHGLKVSLWGDFLYAHGGEDISALLRRHGAELLAWNYGPWAGPGAQDYGAVFSDVDSFLKKGRELYGSITYAGTTAQCLGFAPHNRRTLKIAEAALDACAANAVPDIWLTAWGDTGAEVSPFAALPVIAYYGCRARGMDQAGFEAFFDAEFGRLDAFLSLDLANDLGGDPYYVNSSSKYLLYNDTFLGFMDKSVRDGFGGTYNAHLKTLAAAKRPAKPEYAYLFDTQAALIRALRYKYDLGIRARTAYKSGDKSALRVLAETGFGAAIAAVRRFARVFSAQWLTDNKPFGLEIHEARLGALIYRLGECKKRILDYSDGINEIIPELECEILDQYGNGDFILSLNWGEIISAGVMTEYFSYIPKTE